MKALLFSFLSVFITSGCSGPSQNSINYYQFSTSLEARNVLTPEHTVLLKPIKLIGLSDQQAITQINSNRSVSIANFNYWSEHPKYMLFKSAQHILSRELNNWQVINARVGILESDYFEVEIHINDFAGHEDHGGVISGDWYIFHYDKGQKSLLKTHKFVFSHSLESNGYPALVASLEKSWTDVNIELKTALEKLQASL
jgi:uncharacterized lipoprotein YmbA